MADSWTLIVDGASDGAWNMAVDEALLESYVSGRRAAPTLRLYSWHPPALSLGSRQRSSGSHDPSYLRSRGIGLVRRPTGGRAVLHEDERTYAVVGRLREAPFEGGVVEVYRRISGALEAGLRALGLDVAVAPGARATGPLGPPACFDRPSAREIVVAGRKLVGSAQLLRRGALLQHGSIPIRADAGRLGRAIGASARGARFTDLAEALGRVPGRDEVDAAVVGGFEEALGARFVRDALDPAEFLTATRLRAWKYLASSWTLAGSGETRAAVACREARLRP